MGTAPDASSAAYDDVAMSTDRIERVEDRLAAHDEQVLAILVRLERLEQQINAGLAVLKWAVGGGLITLVATLGLLYVVAQMAAKSVPATP